MGVNRSVIVKSINRDLETKLTYVFKMIHSTIGQRLDPFDRPNLEEQVNLFLKPRSQK